MSLLGASRYTMGSGWLHSCVVGRLVYGIDGKTENDDFHSSIHTASFSVSNKTECRFARLTHTRKIRNLSDKLLTYAFEFFGTLLKRRK
jgi:hypothetical protein